MTKVATIGKSRDKWDVFWNKETFEVFLIHKKSKIITSGGKYADPVVACDALYKCFGGLLTWDLDFVESK